VAIPVDERSLEEILQADAAPYAWLGAGLDAVMPAHVVYPAVDDQPAGFSARWIREILRERLGFAGAIFSDDLCMAGARVAGNVVASAHAALAAGCDFVLVCNDSSAADDVLEHLQWRRTPAFDERMTRLVPRSGAMAPAGVLQSARYRAALQDLQSLGPSRPGLPPPKPTLPAVAAAQGRVRAPR
jgi:beta-N-acetylhexosaminidase